MTGPSALFGPRGGSLLPGGLAEVSFRADPKARTGKAAGIIRRRLEKDGYMGNVGSR
jgi:hypothetical protein